MRKTVFFLIPICLILLIPQTRSREEDPLNLLFMHRTCGQNLLDANLRWELEHNHRLSHRYSVFNYNFDMHEPPEGLGTTPQDWVTIFTDYFDTVISGGLPEGEEYDVIMIKSDFTICDMDSESQLEAYKDAYRALSALLAKVPGKLFVVLTQPPRNPLDAAYTLQRAANARALADWLANDYAAIHTGNYGISNVAVFDFFDVLANAPAHPTEPNGLKPQYREGASPYPNILGNYDATTEFIQNFINTAVQLWLAHSGPMFWTQVQCMVPQTYPGGKTIFLVEVENLTDLPQEALVNLNVYNCTDFSGGSYVQTRRSGIFHFEPFEYKANLIMEHVPNPLPPSMMECPLGYGSEVYNARNDHFEASAIDSVWVFYRTFYEVDPIDRLHQKGLNPD